MGSTASKLGDIKNRIEFDNHSPSQASSPTRPRRRSGEGWTPPSWSRRPCCRCCPGPPSCRGCRGADHRLGGCRICYRHSYLDACGPTTLLFCLVCRKASLPASLSSAEYVCNKVCDDAKAGWKEAHVATCRGLRRRDACGRHHHDASSGCRCCLDAHRWMSTGCPVSAHASALLWPARLPR